MATRKFTGPCTQARQHVQAALTLVETMVDNLHPNDPDHFELEHAEWALLDCLSYLHQSTPPLRVVSRKEVQHG